MFRSFLSTTMVKIAWEQTTSGSINDRCGDVSIVGSSLQMLQDLVVILDHLYGEGDGVGLGEVSREVEESVKTEERRITICDINILLTSMFCLVLSHRASHKRSRIPRCAGSEL